MYDYSSVGDILRGRLHTTNYQAGSTRLQKRAVSLIVYVPIIIPIKGKRKINNTIMIL